MSLPNPSTALATVVVDELVRNGVRRAVLAPGSRSAALALSLAESTEVELHVAVDERCAGFFALGASRAGELVVALTTSGTAAANLFPAVVEADAAGIPLLVLTADRPPESWSTGANQTIDQIHLFGNKVRWFSHLGPGEDRSGAASSWRSIVSQAVAAANGAMGRPGPAHVNISFREPVVPATDDGRTVGKPYLADVAGRPDGAPWTRWTVSEPTPQRLEVGSRTLVVLGAGTPPGTAAAALASGCVVIAEGPSGERIPGTISTAHHLLASADVRDWPRPDTVVQYGRVGLSRNLSGWLESCPRRIVVGEWSDPFRTANQVVARAYIANQAPDKEWVAKWSRAEQIARRVVDETLDADDEISEPRALRDAAAVVAPAGSMVVASSMPVRDLDWFVAPRERLTVIANRGASGIDGFTSTALGVAAIGGPVVAIAGDLALLHDQSGWLLEPRPDLVMVVINNDGGGIFSFLPQAAFPRHFERIFAAPHSREFALFAKFNGLEYVRIGRASELASEIATRQSNGGHLIEVVTDRTANLELHQRVTARVVEALAAADL